MLRRLSVEAWLRAYSSRRCRRCCSRSFLYDCAAGGWTRRRTCVKHVCFLVDVHLRRLLHLSCCMCWLRRTETRHGWLLIRRWRCASFSSVEIGVRKRSRNTSREIGAHRWRTRRLRRSKTMIAISRYTQRGLLGNPLKFSKSLRDRVKFFLSVFQLLLLFPVWRRHIEDIVADVELEICPGIHWLGTR